MKILCKNCGKEFLNKAWGTRHRDHCPFCLHSVHLDKKIGDRKSRCGGLMTPLGKVIKEDGEESVIYRCLSCGIVRKNRVAGDDDYNIVKDLIVISPL